MKKLCKSISLFFVVISLIISTPLCVYAGDCFTDRCAFANFYSKACTASFIDPTQDGYITVSISSSPEITDYFLDKLDLVCSIFQCIPGCEAVDIANKFYSYVESNMTAYVELDDAGTGEFIGEYLVTNGETMFLGHDHPAGYIIKVKSSSVSLAFVKFVNASNIISLQ